MDKAVSRSRSIFGGSGSDPSKIKRLRLRLLVNCKAENYEFVTTKRYVLFPDTKIQNLHVRLFDLLLNPKSIETVMIKILKNYNFYFIRLPL